MTLGERLKRWRLGRDLKQRAAAELAGVPQASWCVYERDEGIPRADTIERLIALTADDSEPLTLEMFADAERARKSPKSDETGPHPVVDVEKAG